MPLARASAGLSGSELQVAPRSAVWKPAAGCPALNRASGSELQVAPRSTVWKRAAGCPALNRLEASCRLSRAQPSGSELQVVPLSTVRLEAICRLPRAQPSIWKRAAGCPALNRLEASCVFCLHRAVGSAAECDDAMRGEARTKKAGLRCCRLAVSIVRRSVAVVVCGTVTCAVATAFKISTRWQQYLQFTRGQHVVVFASKVKVSKD